MGASGRLAIRGKYNGKQGWYYMHYKGCWKVFLKEGGLLKTKAKVTNLDTDSISDIKDVEVLALGKDFGSITDVDIIIDLVGHEVIKGRI